MQSPLAAHADQFLFAQQNNSDEAPFDCSTPTKPTRLPTTVSSSSSKSKPPMVPNRQVTKTTPEYSYEEGPSFDCDGPPPEMGEGVKVDLMGITPIKSNKSSSNNNASPDNVTVMTEPITPSPFKTPSAASSMKQSSSSFGGRRNINNRRSQQQQEFPDEENPFDETPFDEGPSMDQQQEDEASRLDTGVASPTVMTARKNIELEEPGQLISSSVQQNELWAASPIDLKKRVSFHLASKSKNIQRNGDLGASTHSASSCEEVADADADYEADVDPYSDDDDDTLGTAASENHSSVQAARKQKRRVRRVGAQIVMTERSNRSNKPSMEEWCLSNVFDNIATDAALDVADWFTEGYTQGSKHAKTIVYDCLVPFKENELNGEGGCSGEDGEQMIHLLPATDVRSDLPVRRKPPPKKTKRKVSKRKQKYRSTMEGIDDESTSRLPLKRVDSKLATPTVLTRTRSLLEDTPTKDTTSTPEPVVIYDDQALTEGTLTVNSFDSTSTAVTQNLSFQQIDKGHDDETHQQQQEEPADDDDDSVLDQAVEMAALVATKPSPVPPPPQPEKPQNVSENRASEPRTSVTQKKEAEHGQFKMPMSAQKLTMAKAKEVLKAAKSKNGGIQATPMFLEMEPEPKYADVAPKKQEWPPKKTQSEASVPKGYKPPPRKSRPVDRFGYMSVLNDKSNTSSQKESAKEEWW